MIRILFLVVLVFVFGNGYCQKFEWDWAKQVGSSTGSDIISALATTGDTVIAFGAFEGTLPGGSATATGGKDLMARGVLKGGTNAYATLHFSSTGSNDNATDAAAFADFSIVTGKIDGNLSVQGATGTINRTYGAGSFFMAKINSLGTADWVIPNNNAQLSEGQAITTDPLGNIYVAGIYRDSLVLGSSTIRSEGANDVFVAKFNSNGVVQWLKSMGGPGSEEVAGLVYDNGDLIVAGNFNSTFLLSTNQSLIPNVTGQNDVYLVKIDANSATGVHSTFRKAFFSNGAVSAEDIVALSNGNYAVGGGFSTAIDDGSNNFTSAGGTDAFIGIVNSSFNAVLLKKYGGVLTEKITNLEADTNLFAFGEFASNLTFGPYPVSSLSNQKDVFLLAWNNSLLEFAVHGGVMTAGSDIMSATTMKLDSGRMYFGGQFRRRANFGQAGLFTSQGTGFFDGFLASAISKEIFCSISDGITSSNTRPGLGADSLLVCFGDTGTLGSENSSGVTFQWFNTASAIGLTGITADSTFKVGATEEYYAVITDPVKRCSANSDTVTVVVEPEPFNEIKDTIVCDGTSVFTIPLSPTYSAANGSLTGSTGIDNNFGTFLSINAGIGVDTIVYTFTEPNTGCTGVDSAIFEVRANPVINFSSLPIYCQGDRKDTLKFASTSQPIKTGYYSMTTPWGIQDSLVFRSDSLPANPSPGHLVTYNAIDSFGCKNSSSANIILNPKPNVTFNFSPPAPFCKNTPIFSLSGGNQANGIYSGKAVNSLTSEYDASSYIGLSDTVLFSYTDNNSCSDTAEVVFQIDSTPTVTFVTTVKICSNDSLVELDRLSAVSPTANGTGVFTSAWVGAGSNDFFPRLAGVGVHPVQYQFTDNNGCEDSTTTNLTVNALPGMGISAISPICENDSAFLISSGFPTGGDYFVRNNRLIGDILNPTDLPEISGVQDSVVYVYTDPVTGCSNSASTGLLVRRLNGLVFNPELTLNRLCNSDSIDLFAMGDTLFSPPPVTGGRFLDNLGDEISVFKGSKYLPQNSDTGTVVGLRYIYDYSTTGCSDTATRFIQVSYSPVASIKPLAFACAGIESSIEAEGGISYLWDNDSTGSQRSFVQDSATTYYVTVTNINLCSDSTSIKVEMSDGSIISGNNITTTLKKGGNTTIDILDAYSADTVDLIGEILIVNEPDSAAEFRAEQGIKQDVFSSLYYEPNPEFRRNDTLEYQVCDVVCVNVCDTASVIYRVLGDPYDFIPNGFSPNGDGMNDKWVIPGIEAYPENELYIYNRWGNLIFEAAPYLNEWEGQANKGIGGSEKIGDGVFYYVLITNDGDPIKGSIEMKSK